MKVYFIIAMLVFNLAAIAQTPPYVPIDSLMGWWPFNNNAVDESVNTNDGTVNGPIITTNCIGIPNTAYNFDGLNDGITIPALDLSSSDKMSISVWVNPATLSSHAFHEIIRQDNGFSWAPDFLLSFQNYGSILSFGVGTTTSYSELDVSITSGVYVNTWNHIVVVYDGSQRFVYKNAVLISSDSKTGIINYTSSDLAVGCESTYLEPQEFFEGKIDDIGIWRRALNEQEISALYNGGLTSGVYDNSFSQNPTIYPNPTSGNLFVKAIEDSHVEIYSLLGSKIMDYKLVAGENKLDLNPLSNGQYILKIFNDKNEIIKVDKIILSY